MPLNEDIKVSYHLSGLCSLAVLAGKDEGAEAPHLGGAAESAREDSPGCLCDIQASRICLSTLQAQIGCTATHLCIFVPLVVSRKALLSGSGDICPCSIFKVRYMRRKHVSQVKAVSSTQHHDTSTWRVSAAPGPQEIIWGNLRW